MDLVSIIIGAACDTASRIHDGQGISLSQLSLRQDVPAVFAWFGLAGQNRRTQSQAICFQQRIINIVSMTCRCQSPSDVVDTDTSGVSCREAGHLLTKASGTCTVEDLSTLLAENERLLGRQQLLERVSNNPIMNDLFTVINLQVARFLTEDTQHLPSINASLDPANLEPSRREHEHNPSAPQHASPPQPSGQPHASAPRQHKSDTGLPWEMLQQAGSSPVIPSQLCKGRQPLKAIPADDSQALGGAARQVDAYDQRDVIRTPSQNSAEGALMGLESTTPHPACAVRSSTATSAAKRPAEGPHRTSAAVAARGELSAQVFCQSCHALPFWKAASCLAASETHSCAQVLNQ